MTNWIRGTFSVVATPFDANGVVDLAAMAAYTEWQVAEGIHGLIPLGSTGEFLSMTGAERYEFAICVIDTVASRVPVLIGTGAEYTDDAIRYSQQAETLGADGVMIIPPFYSTPTEDEIFEHFRRIAEAITIPVMSYNNPATANVDLTPAIVARLSTIPGVDYIKESTMDVARVRDILDLCGGRMTVFGGIMGYEFFMNGAEGWVAVGSNLMPRECSRLIELSVDEKDVDAARALYRQILPVIRLVGSHRYVAATKSALGMLGHAVGEPRAPRLPTPDAEIEDVCAALTAAGLTPQQEA